MTGASLELRLQLPLAHFTLDVDITSGARSLGLFGPSGSGKTSLLEAIAGWRAPAGGRLRVGDELLFDAQQRRSTDLSRRGIGYVPQDALLFPHWSVGRNVGGDPRDALHARTVRLLEIGHLLERSCQHLSGGERQRVALARALVSRPRLLLLDEPLAALDLALRRRILPYLIRVRDEFELPTLFVSHDATEVQALCDEVVVLEAGRVRAQGRPDEVLRRLGGAGRAFENVLGGRIVTVGGGAASVRLDAGGLAVVPAAGLGPGSRTLFAIGADEILVALDAPSRISARNVLPARVEHLEPAPDGGVRVEARLLPEDPATQPGACLCASLTPGAVSELGLSAGRAVWLVFKTNSCRVLSAAAGDEPA